MCASPDDDDDVEAMAGIIVSSKFQSVSRATSALISLPDTCRCASRRVGACVGRHE
jgi:hypothetical protein